MAKPFNPPDWYWTVAGDVTKFYSSAAGDYVQPANAAYVAWAADGTVPTRIASEAELGEVLASYSLRSAAANVLDSYKDVQAGQLTVTVPAKLLFWIVNQILVLTGQQALASAAQFKAFVKGKM